MCLEVVAHYSLFKICGCNVSYCWLMFDLVGSNAIACLKSSHRIAVDLIFGTNFEDFWTQVRI